MVSKSANTSDSNYEPSTSSSLDETDPLLGAGAEKGKSKASPWHVLVPLFLITFGMGALVAPMVQFYTDIFCNRYYQARADTSSFDVLSWVVGDTPPPLPDIKDCAIPEVQAIVSKIQAILLFIDSGSTFLMASFYGSLSDRHGRRLVFRIFAIGGILTVLCYIAVAKFQEWIGVTLLLVAPLAHGLLAGDVITVAAVQSYISDCTTPEQRTVAFGRMIAFILAGAIVGPTVASIVILKTGSIVNVFYLVIVIYAGFYAHVTCFMPESLDEQAMKQARMKAAQGTRPSIWQTFNIFSALSIISKAKPRHISKYAVPILAAIQFLMAVLGQPPIVLYAMLMFKWTAYENGLLASLISLVRFIVIIVVLPQVVTRLQKYWQQQASSDSTTSEDDTKIRHRILFDTTMVRVGLGIQMFGLLAIAIATTETAFIWALVVECLSVISQPSVRSLYTTLVEPSEVGALCGAQAVLESSATMIALTAINFIYSASVNTMPSLFLYVCAGVSGTGFLLSFLIHPVTHSPDTPLA